MYIVYSVSVLCVYAIVLFVSMFTCVIMYMCVHIYIYIHTYMCIVLYATFAASGPGCPGSKRMPA